MALRLPVVLIVAVLALLSSPGRAASVDALSDDVRCLALTVYWEARSLSPRGHRSVAHVALNRVASDDFPESVCEVVYQGGETRYRCQFSWWCDGKADTRGRAGDEGGLVGEHAKRSPVLADAGNGPKIGAACAGPARQGRPFRRPAT